MTNTPVPLKHHHLPVFYLNHWTGEDGRLCQFSRPYNQVVPKRKHPEETGYVKRLYELPGLPPEEAQQIEQGFMQCLDSNAAEALMMLENDDSRITQESKPRSAWSRFIMSLLMRTPEDIAALKIAIAAEWAQVITKMEKKYTPAMVAKYLAQRDPDYVERWAMSLAPGLIDHQEIGDLLNNMEWLVRRVPTEAGEFLTSDRPVVRSWTLTEPNAYLFLPIGPKAIFVAVSDIATQRKVAERDPIELVNAINQFVAGRAVKFVYACDDDPLDYVRQHMGTRPERRLIELVTERRKTNFFQ